MAHTIDIEGNEMIIRLLHPHPTRQRLVFMYNREMTERVPTKQYEFFLGGGKPKWITWKIQFSVLFG